MTDFVSAVIDVDPTSLLDDAVDQINTTLEANGYPGWTAQDASLAVVLLGTIAQIAADVAQVAATVVPAIFRAFGTQLLGLPYQSGTAATVLTTWTFTSAAPTGGYTVDAGTAVIIDGEAFYVQADVTTATSATSAVIQLVASETGTAFNGLGGPSVGAPRVEPNDQIDWVASIVTQGITSGGADQEDDDTYQSKLVGALKLQAPRPLVAGDFAGMVLSDLAELATGVTVGRATSIDGYFPDGRILASGGAGSTILSCTTTNTSPTVTIVTPPGNQVPQIGAAVTGTGIPAATTVAASPAPTESTFTLSANATASATNNLTIAAMSGYGPKHLTCVGTTTNTSPTISSVTPPYPGAIPAVGARVRGTGIPAGAVVLASPTPTASSFTISANATSSNSAETITVSSWTTVQLTNTTFVTDASGLALPAASMDALQTWLGGYRPQNWLVFVTAPSYTTIYVSVSIHCLPGFDTGTVAANVQAAVLTYLSPASWGSVLQQGNAGGRSSPWYNQTQGFGVVRLNKLLGVVENVAGVDYVPSGGLTLGTSPSPAGTADITLSGPAPLPLATSVSIPLPTVV